MPNIEWQNQRRKVGKGMKRYNNTDEGNYQPHSSLLTINLVWKFLEKVEVSGRLIGAKWGHDSKSICACKFGRKFAAEALRGNSKLFCFRYYLDDVYTYHISQFLSSKVQKPSTAVNNKMKQILFISNLKNFRSKGRVTKQKKFSNRINLFYHQSKAFGRTTNH